MTPRQKIKTSCFTLEGLNSFATVFYFNYLYFLMRDHFGFDNKRNLALASVLGLIYGISAWQTGKFAQRRGYFAALKTGYSIMAIGFIAGTIWKTTAVGQILAAIIVTIGMCFIWPTLEALVSESETADGLPRVVGMYNVVWAGTAAFAFFIGGTFIHLFGYRTIFALPLTIVFWMLVITIWLQRHHAVEIVREKLEAESEDRVRPPHAPASPRAATFLKMAWLANPFAYIAIQTLIAVIPGIADRFQMTPMLTGFICSFWYFVRLGAFVVLWHWTAWHYRFRWLATAFIVLILSFATILMSPDLAVLIVGQILFGAAIGLIYYSSLFYSMDAGGETRGEHGGIHEAAIGFGNCAGPAVGALSLHFLPQFANSEAVAVSILLVCGFGGLLGIWKTAK